MPKRSSNKKKTPKKLDKETEETQDEDVNELAARIVETATEREQPEASGNETNAKNPAAVILGRLGGLKGGKARADKLTSEQRSEIARKAAQARWKSSK